MFTEFLPSKKIFGTISPFTCTVCVPIHVIFSLRCLKCVLCPLLYDTLLHVLARKWTLWTISFFQVQAELDDHLGRRKMVILGIYLNIYRFCSWKNLEIKIIRTVSSERSFLKILESILSWAWIFIVTTKWDLCNLLNPIYWWLDIPALVIKGNQIIGMCVAHWYGTPGCSRSISGSNPGISQSTNLGRRADPPWAWGTKRVNKNNLPGDREQLPYTEATVLEISRLASVLPIAPPRQVAQCTIVAEEPFSFRLD